MFYYGLMCPKYADRMANSVDLNRTAQKQSHMGLHSLSPDLSVQKLRFITIA